MPDLWYQYSTCDVFLLSRSDSRSPNLIAQGASDLAGTTDPSEASAPASSPSSGWLQTHGENNVVSCSWNKDTSSPAGVFTIGLKPRENYLETIQPGDLLLIFMSAQAPVKQGQGTLVTIGVVER